MTDSRNRSILPAQGGGFFQDLSVRIRLILRLLADRRVNPLLKLLPIGSLAYLIVPDIAPGPLDDAAIIWLGTYLFVELCPPDVVQEHLKNLRSPLAEAAQRDPLEAEGEIIDAEFREEDKED
ncbi:MAG: hypothetical protein L0Z70_14900 [Chloroflexi bacterium]|nr:hypothetical protein [Chloroflexota bacterium]